LHVYFTLLVFFSFLFFLFLGCGNSSQLELLSALGSSSLPHKQQSTPPIVSPRKLGNHNSNHMAD
jgi:hypothetical protein